MTFSGPSVSDQQSHLKLTWELMSQLVHLLQVGPLGRDDPLEGSWQPTPVFLPGKSRGQRSLASYSPWGRKESDTTERYSVVVRIW